MIIAIILALVAMVAASRWPRRVTWALFLLLPFQIALNPFPGIDLLAGRVAIPFVTVGILLVLWRNHEPLRLSPLLWLALFSAGIGTVSLLWSPDPSIAFQRSLVWWSLIPVIVLGEWLFSFPEERKRIPLVLSYLVSLVSVTALLPVFISLVGGQLGGEVVAHPSWFVDSGGSPLLRAFLPFPDPHMLAFFLAATLPFVVIRRTRLSVFAAMLGGLALLATFSRGGYVGSLVALLLAIPFIWRHSSLLIRRSIVAVIAVAIIALVVPNPFGDRFWSSFDLSEGSVAGRTETMRGALVLIRQFPVSGVGLGQYASTLVPLASVEAPIYAHSSYLDTAATLGIPALLAFVIAVGIIFIRRFRSFSRAHYNSLRLAALLAFTWFSVHALFETPIYSPRVLPYFLLTLVLLFSTLYEEPFHA